jgi:hypothetical protein
VTQPHITEEDLASAPPRKRHWKQVIRWSVATVVILIVAREVSTRVSATDFQGLRVKVGWLIASVAALPWMYLCIAASERRLVEAFTGRKLAWRDALAAAWVPIAGKYVPGKVVAAGSAVLLLRRLGVPAAAALAVFVVLDGLPVLTGTVLASTLLLRPEVAEAVPVAPVGFAIIVTLGIVALSPRVFRWGTTLGLRLLRRPPLERTPGWRDYRFPLLMALGQWTSNGLSVWFAMNAFAETPTLATLPYVSAATALAMCVSYFSAVIMPGGAVFREGAFVALLTPIVGFAPATATAAAMRLNHVLVEAVLCGTGLVLLRRSTEQDETRSSLLP